jgi:hypothetical protein
MGILNLQLLTVRTYERDVLGGPFSARVNFVDCFEPFRPFAGPRSLCSNRWTTAIVGVEVIWVRRIPDH